MPKDTFKKDNLYEKISIISYKKKLNHISYNITKIGYDKGKKRWYFLIDTQYSNNETGVNKALINIIKDLNSHIWDQWADEEGSIGKAYGYQFAKKYEFKTKEGIKEMDQVDRSTGGGRISLPHMMC